MKLKRNCLRLYAVTDRAWLNGGALESQVADAIAGGAGIVQLREKALDDAAFLAEARWFVPLCKKLGAVSIINDNVEIAMDFHTQLRALLSRDATGRGLAQSAPAPDFDALTDTLLSAKRAVILTGFPVNCGARLCGETDGPGGAANLARALMAVDCTVTLLTDPVSLPQVRAAANCLASGAEVICLPDEGSKAFAESLLAQLWPTHFFTIERPGKGADGHFHNMRSISG